ncbi:hypothetical protein HNR02_003471 [Amycolatopsis endophytica]|uniref:Uncharacterized protein n=1 Tax=Amycolatopsis endophytica TaxID=860233 RepID=A0A853B4P4_9PSEU|nr:hypothetical protein [Amycolatopsis endophytica]NYI90148.1 hypothetical protein [Amycolatopsis endophytica]
MVHRPDRFTSVVDGPRELAALRRRARVMLAGVGEQHVVDALLVTDEIASIAWLSTRQPFTVRLGWAGTDTVRVDVTITAEPPGRREIATSAAVLDGVAARWGMTPRPGETALWADVAIAAPSVPDKPALDAVHVAGSARR